MPSKKATAQAGVKGAKVLARHPTARKATARVGKVVVKRKARAQVERLADASRTARQTVVIYGPPAAQLLGLTPPPKPNRTVPAFGAGIVIGAGAVYFLEPAHGAEHRRQIQQLLASRG
jgi:hypothetical protein